MFNAKSFNSSSSTLGKTHIVERIEAWGQNPQRRHRNDTSEHPPLPKVAKLRVGNGDHN